jgi:GntR family phosphonate transport system transcriptional regulator
MEVARGNGHSLWRQIETTLAGEIAAGVHKAGDRFPTEHQLAERFGVNRHTVRRAVAELVQRGLLRVEQGRGAFLAEHALDYAVGPRTRFTENLLRQGRRPQSELLRAVEVPAGRQAARALEVKPGTALVMIENLARADGRPLSIAQHFFPQRRVPGIAEAYRQTLSVTLALQQIGIEDYRRRSTRITARMPEPEEARLLRMAPGRPLLITESVNVDLFGKPIEYGLTSFVADRVQLLIES